MAVVALRADRRPVPLAYRRRTKPVPRPIPPSALILSYTRILRGMSREMNAAILATVRAVIPRTDAMADEPGDADPDFPPALIARLERVMLGKLREIASRKNLVGAIDRLATQMVGFTRQEWGRQLKTVFGIDLKQDPDLSRLVDEFRARQGELITSMGRDKVRAVKRALRENRNARVEDIASAITNATGATDYRASLIARTEVTTTNARLSRARHEAAGITEFIVSTSRDERVRESHKVMEGRRFSYAKLPLVDGEPWLPGATYQCRCLALAALPEIDSDEAEDVRDRVTRGKR